MSRLSDCFESGNIVEDKFVEICRKLPRVVKVWKATPYYENAIKKIDVYVQYENGGIYKFQVKSHKKNNDELLDLMIVEFRVENKYHESFEGWLYGDYDYVVFNYRQDFLVFRRDQLAKYSEEKRLKTEALPKLRNTEIIPYQEYFRKSNLDKYDHPNERIMYIPKDDLTMDLEFKVLK